MAEEFDDKEDIIKPKQQKVGYNQIVDSLFGPSDYLKRSEMSIMPSGNKAYQWAIVVTKGTRSIN
jgi:hypothetical protein